MDVMPRGVKIDNVIYGKVIKSNFDHVYKTGSYRSVTADTFVRVPKKLWKIIEKMD